MLAPAARVLEAKLTLTCFRASGSLSDQRNQMTQRILLIEDELGLVMTLSDRLKSEGYAVVTAQDGETGLARATNETFDLIILDVMLPHRGGFDVCRDLRQRGVRTPIIMLTAREEMRGRALGVLSLAIGTGPFGSLFMGAAASAIHPVFVIRMNALLGIMSLAFIMVLMPAFTERTQSVRVTPTPRQGRGLGKDN